jgi:hypothetical protein
MDDHLNMVERMHTLVEVALTTHWLIPETTQPGNRPCTILTRLAIWRLALRKGDCNTLPKSMMPGMLLIEKIE